MTSEPAAATDDSARHLLLPAGDRFSARVHAVRPDAWAAPTPCSDWDVRALVNHVVGEHLWAVPLLAGETVEQVGDRFEGDVLGDDPVGAWDAAWAASRRAWAAVDSDDVPVHLSRGPTPAGSYAEEMLLDLVVHGWDLARGAGLDEAGDPAAVEHVLRFAETEVGDDWSGTGMFDQPMSPRSDDPQDRLLALLGRKP